MNGTLPILFAAFVSIICFGIVKSSNDSEKLPDVVVMGYNSYDTPMDTLIFSSIHENEQRNVDGGDPDIISVGSGQHLWGLDENGMEIKRGWMYRLRLMIQKVKDEYQRRNQEDFIVILGDSLDVMITKSASASTLDVVRERFMSDFAEHQIVFSAQIYCCNPWDIREFARRDWDALYNDKMSVPSIYKHLNAGSFMGYASAIMTMADEMKIWSTTYHHHESFHSLVGLDSTKNLHMGEIEVDDDEWQLSAWFLQDQKKKFPMAALDYDQNIFAVTGTVRIQESNDNTFIMLSKDHFYNMYGNFPDSFDGDTDLDQLGVCPYEYDTTNMQFTSTLTGGHPLIFHFAGNEWICACKVFAESGYHNIPKKFRDNCKQRYEFWGKRAVEGVTYIAHSSDNSAVLHLHGNVDNIGTDIIAQKGRRLNSETNEDDRRLQFLNPYKWLVILFPRI